MVSVVRESILDAFRALIRLASQKRSEQRSSGVEARSAREGWPEAMWTRGESAFECLLLSFKPNPKEITIGEPPAKARFRGEFRHTRLETASFSAFPDHAVRQFNPLEFAAVFDHTELAYLAQVDVSTAVQRRSRERHDSMLGHPQVVELFLRPLVAIFDDGRMERFGQVRRLDRAGGQSMRFCLEATDPVVNEAGIEPGAGAPQVNTRQMARIQERQDRAVTNVDRFAVEFDVERRRQRSVLAAGFVAGVPDARSGLIPTRRVALVDQVQGRACIFVGLPSLGGASIERQTVAVEPAALPVLPLQTQHAGRIPERGGRFRR